MWVLYYLVNIEYVVKFYFKDIILIVSMLILVMFVEVLKGYLVGVVSVNGVVNSYVLILICVMGILVIWGIEDVLLL